MKQHKLVSKNKDDSKREVIAIDDKGNYKTLHVHKKKDNWQYLVKKDKEGRQVFGVLQ